MNADDGSSFLKKLLLVNSYIAAAYIVLNLLGFFCVAHAQKGGWRS